MSNKQLSKSHLMKKLFTDLGASYADGTDLVLVERTPSQGQYCFDEYMGGYFFCKADSGRRIRTWRVRGRLVPDLDETRARFSAMRQTLVPHIVEEHVITV